MILNIQTRKIQAFCSLGPFLPIIIAIILLFSNARCGVLMFFSKVESAELKKKKKEGMIVNSLHMCEFTKGRKIKMWEQQFDGCLYLNICSQYMKNMNKARRGFYEDKEISFLACQFFLSLLFNQLHKIKPSLHITFWDL